uniref:Alpha-conotoxin PiXXA n=1 Tax=Conus princeps TaxID=101311 RepID=CDKA_CONPG|nr:RecName: Full=Alpha-conotoxin PiXXA; Flags: Precursor [Conus princeps]
MPKLEMMLLVLLILPLPYFDAAGGQSVHVDGYGDGLARYLQRGERAVKKTCIRSTPGSNWGRCCLTKMCHTLCCARSDCTCVYRSGKGHGCSCTS